MQELVSMPWWAIIFLFIGVLALATVLASLFLSVGRRPHKLTLSKETPAVDTADFLQALAGAVNAPIQSGGKAVLLNNGEAYFPAIVEAIEGAQYSVNFMVYIWNPGK